MKLSGIHLTEQGSPVGLGKIGLFRNGKPYPLRQHQSLILLNYRNKDKDMICLHETVQEKNQSTGFYKGLPDTRDADFSFFLPQALVVFINNHLRHYRPGLTDTMGLESSQNADRRSYQMGGLYVRRDGHQDFIHLRVARMAATITHQSHGIEIEILAELKSIGAGAWVGHRTDKKFDVKADYRLDLSMQINRETCDFRYQGKISEKKSVSGLSRIYPGDEVQTDLLSLNLKHPLVYNRGGVYALSKEGVYALDLTSPGRIQPSS